MTAEPTDRIIAFIRGIGIPVATGAVPDSFLPGIAVRSGGLVCDPDRLTWPGDLLHEAGHIAVTHPDLRPTLDAVVDDPAEEMATLAWSYAAVVALELDPEVLFHAGGYMGGGDWLRAAFSEGATIGQPMLCWFGMTHDAATAARQGVAPYPHMTRWLR